MKEYDKEIEEFDLASSTDIVCLSKRNIIAIHDAGVEEFGGIYGVRDEGLLDSVCKAPYQSCFGTDLYPSVFDKAAKYLFDFATYQVFLDGNKRVGLGASTMLLMANGYELNMDFSQAYELTMKVANGKIADISEVAKILKDCSQQKDIATYLDNEEREGL